MLDARPGDVRDRAVPDRGQMLGRQPPDLLIVGQHAVAAHVGVIVAVDHHDALAGRDHFPEQVRVARGVRRRQHQAVDLPLLQNLQLLALLVRVLAGAAQQQGVAALREDRFDGGDDLDEERMHQIGDDDAEGLRPAKGQAARDRVGAVAQLLHFLQDTRARDRPDVGLIVQDFGDGGDRDPELQGDPLHRKGHRGQPLTLSV